MGKAGRIACIFTPFALTLASLICLILIFLGGTNKSSSVAKYYFFRADLANFTTTPDVDLVDGTNLDNSVLSSALGSANASANLKQYYAIYLWNYCAGNGNEAANNDFSFCSERQSSFWFNPIEVWGLNNTSIEKVFPEQLQNGLKVYQKVSHWMFVAYVVALVATIAELAVGLFATCSRWGSFFTTVVSGVSSLFTIGAAVTATALFSTLAGTFNTVLKPYHIDVSLGRSLFIATWLAVAFSLASGFFWFLSVCCCSGRSPYHKDAERSGGMFGAFRGGRKSVTVEKTPYTYERVESPYLGPQQSGVTSSNPSGAAASYYNIYPQAHGGYAPVNPHTHTHTQDVPMISLQRPSRDMDTDQNRTSGAYEPFRRQG